MMEQTFEQRIDMMMKSDPAQYMLTLRYHPRNIRKALERIYRRKIIGEIYHISMNECMCEKNVCLVVKLFMF